MGRAIKPRMYKKKILSIFIPILLYACSYQPYWKEGNATPTVEQQSIGVQVSNAPIPPVTTAIVIAKDGLRLRDFPDGHGSHEVVLIPYGSEFSISYCRDFDGVEWAYGSFQDADQVWIGWVAARYLDQGCG